MSLENYIARALAHLPLGNAFRVTIPGSILVMIEVARKIVSVISRKCLGEPPYDGDVVRCNERSAFIVLLTSTVVKSRSKSP